MRYITVLAASLAAANAFSVRSAIQKVLGSDSAPQRYLIETAPGETRWIFEDEKWELRRVCRIRVPGSDEQD